ncbi:MAG: alpha-galactosidase [Acidimicrobiales bacterium]|nr:alpha-galactosidase [Acidimicrobiales bacterium]
MADAPRFDLDAGTFVLSLAVAPDGRLHQVGLAAPGVTPAELPFPVSLYPLAHPTFGEEPDREPALRITHGDGALGTRLVFRDASSTRAVEGGGVDQVIEMADRVAPTQVSMHYRTWPEHALLEAWVTVTNDGTDKIVVHEAAATALAFAGPDPHLTHWGGGWAAEWTETVEPVRPGTKTVASIGGVRPSLSMPPIVLFAPDGWATETEGTVAACTLMWGGDSRFDVERSPTSQLRLFAGHQHRGADRHLDAGESFETPHALWAWSDAGIGRTSRALHSFTRARAVRDGSRVRVTVSNTWEAVGMRIDTPTLAAQVDAAADIGAELFLLDDGWFGDRFPRDDDDQGLGDWIVDRAKFPDGLGPTIERTLDAGMRFGLWIEPEMVNPRSELYEQHPDWVVTEPDRERREFRQQLLLDLCLPEVQEFVVDTVDRILEANPGISYLKWDANRDVYESWSATLPRDRQSHHPVDRVRATWKVMDEIARRHPDVELMLCASGGGRSELGTLRWFHEVWTSDNTDPVDRLRIQWGASHLLPASTLGAHVTRWGQRPIPFGCAVAMSGRFGFDLDLTALTDEERTVCRQASADYAAIRDLVQFGDLYRLVSPLGLDRAAIAYVDPSGERAVLFAWVFHTDRVIGEANVAVPADGVHLPEVLQGRDWTWIDRTPGRSSEASAKTVEVPQDGVITWPDGPYGARIIELVRH